MVTIDNAYYNGELWCAYELKDNQGNYDEELRLKMRKESQNGKFSCPDCGEHLILCAGPIMEPFFKHHENANCVIRSTEGGIRYNLGKRLLYQLAKRSFPEARITNNMRINNKYRSGILVDTIKSKIGMEYICYDMKLDEWEEKHNCFKDNNIIDVWILNNKKYKEEHLQTFEYLISKNASPIIKILNQDNEKIILKQYITIEECEEKLPAIFEYKISDITIMENGEFDCDFTTICNRDAAIVNERLKLERLSKEEQERLIKQEHEAMLQEERERWKNEKKVQREQREQESYYNSQYSFNYDNQPMIQVQRETLNDSTLMNSNKMKMSIIKEAWELPQLIGSDSQVRRAGSLRYIYMKEINKEFGQLQGDERERKICEAIEYLEKNRKATNWF